MPRFPLRPLTALLALALSAGAHAQSEDMLLERLASSTDRAELRETARRLGAALQEGAGDDAYWEDVVRVLTTSPELRRTTSVNWLLMLITRERTHSERALSYLAEALSAEPRFSSYDAMTEALQARAGDLPDSVFEILLDGFSGPHPVLALRVLAEVPAEDPRNERIIDGIVDVIRTGRENNTAQAMIRDAGKMHDDRPMPARLVDALYDLTLTDPSLDVRLEALAAIAPHPLGAERAEALATTLYRNVMTPNAAENGELEYSQFSHSQYRERLAGALLQVLASPYPDYVVDLWLDMLWSTRHTQAMDVLQGIIDRQGLGDAQFSALARKLDGSVSLGAYPQHPLLLDFAPMPPGELEQAVTAFPGDGTLDARIAAGYRLYYHYRDRGVPVAIADLALDNLSTDAERGLLPVSLVLVRNAAGDTDRYTSELIERVRPYANDNRVYRRYLQALGPENSAQIALRHAANVRLPGDFRASVIDFIDPEYINDDSVRSELIGILGGIARTENDNSVVQAAGRSLDALDARAPLRVALRNANNQRDAMMIGFLAMLVGNTILFFVGLAAIAWPVPDNPAGEKLSVAGWLVLWLLLSAAMGIALIIGFLGFIGHTSAPPVGWTLGALMPSMLGTIVYVIVAVAAVRRTRRYLRAVG